jgi:glutaminase
MFGALDLDGSNSVSSSYFLGFLRRKGLQPSDKRLANLMGALTSLDAVATDRQLTLQEFADAIASCTTLVHKCVTGGLRIPDFDTFAAVIKDVFTEVLPNKDGANADYIPQLAEVNPDQFGISVTSVDGQHYSVGDSDVSFNIQSCSKPLSYLIAQTEFGPEYVHRHVGTEPSGQRFNEITLKAAPTEGKPGRQIPHNPMINAGAMMTVSMVFPELSRAERLERVLGVWKRLSGGPDAPIGYDDATYRSESGTADRNWCLAYMMKEKQAFPPCFTNLSDTLELYFQICSILATNDAMSVMAATLANGGLNPISGDRVFETRHVRNVLPLMLTSGMYDYSGQWAYDIGVPAKSGVGGCVFIVIPNVCGISIWSPRLDEVGNSARGVAVAKVLVRRFRFHNFEVFSGSFQDKWDPTMGRSAAAEAALFTVLFAASQGDAAALENHVNAGGSLFEADYDSRTALHLAASEGHTSVVKYIVDEILKERKNELLSATDRWGGTPLSDAIHHGHTECIDVLRAAGGTEGVAKPPAMASSESESSSQETIIKTSKVAPHVLFAAANGNLDELVTLRSSGADLALCDYDLRTPLHLAASNGHHDVIRYLLAQAGAARSALLQAKDRWGFTAHDDAVREMERANKGDEEWRSCIEALE